MSRFEFSPRISLNGQDISHLVKEISLSRGYRTIGDMTKSITREIEDRKFLRSIGISSEMEMMK